MEGTTKYSTQSDSRDATDKGFPELVNLIGIESSGLTSALAIGGYVADIVDSMLESWGRSRISGGDV